MEEVSKKLKVAHYTDTAQKTGLTVFIPDKRASCGYYVCGASPGMRETAVLDFGISNKIDALVFTGGSCFGLGATNGVMKWLAERKKGVKIGKRFIPIVPAACIFDEGIYHLGSYPKPENAYEVCEQAISAIPEIGRKGAGTGAATGKLSSYKNIQAGGFGYSFIEGAGGLWVASYIVVNSMGSIFNIFNNQMVKDTFEAEAFLFSKANDNSATFKITGANTTLVAVFTNAKLSDKSLQSVAKMAGAGMAQAISPCFTPYDGDVVFSISLDNLNADITTVGILAKEATRQAILNAVTF